MKFLVDAQLPVGLCRWLEEHGHEANYAPRLLGGDRSDQDVARLAAEQGMIVVTKDRDFVALQTRFNLSVLWLRCGNMLNAKLYAWLERRWPSTEPLLSAGEKLVEVPLPASPATR